MTGKAWYATVLLILAVGAAGCAPGDAADTVETGQERAAYELLPADVAEAGRTALDETVVLTGSLEPYRVVNLTAQVPGTVVALHADRGVSVRAGQPLAVLEAEGIRGAAEAAESQLVVARQSLEGARSLYEAGAMSELDYEAARAAFEAARAAATGTAETARRATVASPMDGVVSARWVSQGEPVNPGQPMFTVVDTRILELRGHLPVDAAARVRPGQPVRFEVSGFPDRVLEGRVDRIEPTADSQTRQVGISARMANRDRLPGGMFARGRIVIARLDEVVTVPWTALRGTPQGPLVYVLEGGAIRHRSVTTGPTDDVRGLIAILEGLEAGERVIVTPTVEVMDGTPARLAGAAAEQEG